MKKLLFFFLSAFLFSFVGRSQSWNQMIPKEIKKAYQNKTRSIDGTPGPAYWQNRADYTIETVLNAGESKLSGHEKVIYHNESPDTLKYIVIRLYQDFYKKGNLRTWKIDGSDITKGVDYNKLKVTRCKTGKSIYSHTARSATNLRVFLTQPLEPGDSLCFETDWSFHIPQKSWNRMGNYGNDVFMIAYWYPQIAVYDDIDGWDMVEFNGVTEFYNDFNNYDVKITVPPGFKVWATGELQNGNNLYTRQIFKRIKEAYQSDEINTLFTAQECREGKVLKNNRSETEWHFKAAYVPDFTFGVAKAVNWQGSSLIVDTLTGRRTFVDAVFPDSMITFPRAAKWCRWSVDYMSKVLPGVPFPYPHITSWSNGRRSGGMESPMMANNGDPKSEASAAGLFFHEISHSYFPFYTGTNERKYAWMDEGWAAYLTRFIYDSLYPGYHYAQRMVSTFENMSGSEKEVVEMIPSYLIADWQTYRSHAYNRSSMAYTFLRDLLGDSLFIKGLHTYMKRWHGRHPMPYDFFASMEAGTGQSLNWFFKPWFFEKVYADLGIKKVTLDNKVVIQNYGGLPLPVKIVCRFDDGTKLEIYKTAALWKTGLDAAVIEIESDKKIKSITLGDDLIPDINKANNRFNIEPLSDN
jgi:hypothetical protein